MTYREPAQNNVLKKTETSGRSKKWKWILKLSLFLAVLLSITGLFISGLAYFSFIERPKIFTNLGTFLILFAVPLYFLAAHCLDKIDLRKK